MTKGYKIDFVNNTLTISKAFEDAAAVPYSEEYKLLQQIRADFPNLTIVRKARRTSTTKKRNKNMTYANMEKYMSVFQNADKLLAQFEVVKRQSKLEKSPYQLVLSWFVEQFPDYQELPDFNEKAKNVIDLGAFMQDKEKVQVQRQEKAGA